ncbi:MAG: AAA family ATPase [Cytophagales bacterium]
MLEAIRIQNFRSIEDVTLDLQQINLLIGANNSGKSNFLKALEFLKSILTLNSNFSREVDFSNYVFRGSYAGFISFTLYYSLNNSFKYAYCLELYFDEKGRFTGSAEILIQSELLISRSIQNKNFEKILKDYKRVAFRVFGHVSFSLESDDSKLSQLITENIYDFCIISQDLSSNSKLRTNDYNSEFVINNPRFNPLFEFDELLEKILNVVIYKPNPDLYCKSSQLQASPLVSNDGSNLVSFLFNLGQNYKKVYAQLEKDLEACVGDLVSISTPTDPQNPTELKIKFFDKNDNAYWADEVSEGVLYFLALLCIIHQPNPPKLLLLEEPEKGIHPVRLQEVMNFVFKLAEDKDIQVIMTSHSPLLLEEFKDIPESVFIFDKEGMVSKVKNLQKDIIEPENKQREVEGLPKSDYTSSLSSHWTVGLIGGVPK